MKRESAMFCAVLLLVLTGCTDAPQQPDQGQPPVSEQPSSVWVDSEDGVLSVRLGAPNTTVDSEDPITVVAELRNNSDEPVNVLRPFGDWYAAIAVGIDLNGPDGPLRYTGDELESEELGHDAFATLEPGQSIYDWLDLTVADFAESDADGRYTIRYTYSVPTGHRETADRIGLNDLSTGEITSRAVTVTKRESPTASKTEQLEGVVSIQFPKDEYEFTLAEVAKGIRFEYRIVVRRELDGVIPRPQDIGCAAGPDPSGLYPLEEISGDGQSYSLRDIGLGWHDDRPRLIEKGWPFPPGTYTLKVRLAGETATPEGRRPYGISRSASVRLVP